ncbi:hypothetical protein BLS_002682 [Venturia inaequalis]|nr:hypothetical protein BLS_002682 [Venturia inaequalis]
MVIGIPLVPVTEHAVAISDHNVDTHSAFNIARDISNNGAAGIPVVTRNIEILQNKYILDNTATTKTDHTINARDLPLGTCVNAFSEGGKQGQAQRDLCTDFNRCLDFAPWASGGVRSMGFRGSTTCILYTTQDCSGNKLLLIHENSAGVNIANGAEFRLGGPWMSGQCSRAW